MHPGQFCVVNIASSVLVALLDVTVRLGKKPNNRRRYRTPVASGFVMKSDGGGGGPCLRNGAHRAELMNIAFNVNIAGIFAKI